MTITAKELAQLCGVSRGTIDRALKGRGGINAETCARIRAMAELHGYRPDPIGAALVSGRTMTVGVVLFDFNHSYFAELFAALSEEAETFNYELLPLLSHADPQRERICLERLATRRVDGIVMLPVNQGEVFCSWLKRLRIPTVCLANRLSPDFPFIGTDDRMAARSAVEFLAASGARYIHYFGPPLRHAGKTNLFAQNERLDGYRDAIGSNPYLQGKIVTDHKSLLKLLLSRDPADTAVLCSSDFYAMDLQLLLKENHPKYVGIRLMGFDGLKVLKYAAPPIASVGFCRRAMAENCFAQLRALIAGQEVEDVIIPYSLKE